MKVIKKITLSAMFLAIGMILPFFTGQIPQIGSMLLPMHIPVFLCSFLCGFEYGVTVGVILPLFRSLVFSMPPLFPQAVSMALELGAYGFFAGFLYQHSNKKVWAVYRSLLLAMIAGRAVWGMAQLLFLGIQGNSFTLQMFLAGALLHAVPGILIQLLLIPGILFLLRRAGLEG